MTILVTGSREWTCISHIKEAIVEAFGDTKYRLLIHGGARGADRIAGKVCEDLGIPYLVYVADWETHGKSAGIKRNMRMLDDGNPDLVLAFPYPTLAQSRGTNHMVNYAKRNGVPVKIFTHH